VAIGGGERTTRAETARHGQDHGPRSKGSGKGPSNSSRCTGSDRVALATPERANYPPLSSLETR
jgi:hypothetical protein